MSYNGWRNKETWLINLWLGDYFTEVSEDTPMDAMSIKREVENHFEEITCQGGLVSDMLNCALGEIDYHELASHYEPYEEE